MDNEDIQSKEENIINEHKKMLMISGKLSSFQIENLKNFPMVAFDGVKEFKLDYNFYKYNDEGEKEICSGRVLYDLNFSEKTIQNDISEDELKKRGEALKFFVRTLFWKDTKVEINREGSEWI